MNYFELYPGDYLRDTTRLSMVEHGAYLRLLMTYYAEEMPLPSDEAELFIVAGAVSSIEKAAVRKVADRFFPVAEDGCRHNTRADREIAKAQKRIETARSNGSKNKPGKNPPAHPAGDPAGGSRVDPADTQRQTRSGEALHVPPVDQELPATPGAEAPPADPIWGTGLDFLLRKGLPKASARSFLGLLRKELHDDLTVAELLLEAERQDISNPQAWLTQAAKQRKLQNGAGYAGNSRNRESAADRVARINAEAAERSGLFRDGDADDRVVSVQ